MYCPFCYEAIDPKEIEYRCIDPACSGSGEEDEKYAAYRGVKTSVKGGHVFKGERLSAFSRFANRTGLLGSLRRPKCTSCKGSQVEEICPECHNPLPRSSIEGANHTIAVVGTMGAGKSHYIATLINELQERVGEAFGAAVTPFTSFGTPGYSADKLYRDTKYKPLYEQHETFGRTQRVGGPNGLEDDKIPLVYTWNRPNGPRGLKDTFTLSFIDVAGEDVRDAATVARAAKYLSCAQGIILLVDP